MPPTIILISGANRGLGKGFLERYLARPNHIVVAANRDPEHATSKALFDLPTGPDSRLIVVKTDVSVETDPAQAVEELTTKHGIDHLDLVIANAAVCFVYSTVAELKTADLQAHIIPNVFGVLWLYQATFPLLRKAEKPKWVTMGSSAGWLDGQRTFPIAAYGPTKTMVHWLTKMIDGEEEHIAAFVIDPGWVQTEMGNNGAIAFGMKGAPMNIKDSCDGVVALIDSAAKESHGGKMWGHDGKQQTW